MVMEPSVFDYLQAEESCILERAPLETLAHLYGMFPPDRDSPPERWAAPPSEKRSPAGLPERRYGGCPTHGYPRIQSGHVSLIRQASTGFLLQAVTDSYRGSFLDARGVSVSTARAGNVIGGGDFAPDRIIPDCIRAARAGKPIQSKVFEKNSRGQSDIVLLCLMLESKRCPCCCLRQYAI